MRIVPKFKTHYGSIGTAAVFNPGTAEESKQAEEALRPNKDGIVAERSEVIAKLHNEFARGCVTVSTKKHVPNDIEAITPTA